MTPETLRMLERLINVLIAGMSIYLGFRLFLSIPHSQSGEGKFTFPGGSVHLMRTGPGVFFALFGCAIIYWSFSNIVKTSNGNFSGISEETSQVNTQKPSIAEHPKIKDLIGDLNAMQHFIGEENNLDSDLETKIFNTIHRNKVLLIGLYHGNPEDPDLNEFGMRIISNPAAEFEDQKLNEWADLYNY